MMHSDGGRRRWNRELAAQATRSREINWRGVASLTPDEGSSAATLRRQLQPGEPVALWGVPGRSDLNGRGALVVDGKSVQLIPLLHVGTDESSHANETIDVPDTAMGPLPNWPFLGVTLACLREFAETHVEQIRGATTEDVCDSVCKPITAQAQASVATCLKRTTATCDGQPLVGTPTVFISHARKYLFSDLVATVEADASEQHEPAKVFLWIDIFSQYQHMIGDVGCEGRFCNWDVVFQITIRSIGQTCVVLSPWRDPLPLRRAWILWEVLCTIAGGAALHLHLPPSEAASFAAGLNRTGNSYSGLHSNAPEDTGFGSIWRSLSVVDSRSAECFTAPDQTMIHTAIEQSIGHSALNRLIFDELRKWLVHSAESALQMMDADTCATSPLLNNLVALLFEHGQLSEALPLARGAVAGRRQALGDTHPSTLHSINSLAMVLSGISDVPSHRSEAIALFREALAGNREALGATHKQTVGVMVRLANSLHEAFELEEAAALLDEAAAACRGQPLDRTHTMVLSALASLRADQGRADEGLRLLHECADACTTEMGRRHPDTLGTLNNLGLAQMRNGQLTEAMAVLSEVRGGYEELLGKQHPSTLSVINLIGETMERMGDSMRAEHLHRQALSGRRAVLGNQHGATLTSIERLGNSLFALGKHEEAMELFQELMVSRSATAGPRHPATLEAVARVVGMFYASHREQQGLEALGQADEIAAEVLGEENGLTKGLRQLRALLGA